MTLVVTLLLWHCCDSVVVTLVMALLLWYLCCDTVVVALLSQMGDTKKIELSPNCVFLLVFYNKCQNNTMCI